MKNYTMKCSECNDLVIESYEDDVEVTWSQTICSLCDVPDVPELPDMSPEGKPAERRIQRRPSLLNKLICKVQGHIVNPGDYIDSHGNDDSLSFCERCGEYDV